MADDDVAAIRCNHCGKWFWPGQTREMERHSCIEKMRSIINAVAACYEGRFDEGGHIYVPADVWNRVKDEAERVN